MTNTEETTVISSYLIRAIEEDVPQVIEALKGIAGLEVHDPVGFNIPVSLELPSLDATEKVAKKLKDVPGVLTVNLVYVNFEDDPVIGLNAKSSRTVEDFIDAGFEVNVKEG